jgi:hypothetical protein
MKTLLLTIATLGLAGASHAQLTVVQPAPPQTNRATLTAQMPAERNALSRPYPHGHRHRRGQDPLVWVDADGKTVGRFASETSVVVPFKGQLAQVLGLEAAAEACQSGCGGYLGRARWSMAHSLWYTSSDCSGQAYMASRVTTTPYVGTPIVEADTTYIYFSRLADITTVVWKSRFERNQCLAGGNPQGLSASLFPVAGVIAASELGAEPFTIK